LHAIWRTLQVWKSPGLSLEQRKAPVERLIIDHLEKALIEN